MLNPHTKKNNEKVISEINSLKKKLVEISLDALEQLYIPGKKLFGAKRVVIDGKVINKGESIRYTLIALLGLYKAKEHGLEVKIDLNDVLFNLFEKIDKINSAGDIGLLLWICSLVNAEKVVDILAKINFANILSTFPDSRKRKTTELSWLLIGLLSASIFNKNFASVIENLPQKVYQELRNNYGGNGIFGHEAFKTFKLFPRNRIGTFSDQIYAIYAFTMYSKVFQNEEASIISLYTAETLCKAQGKNGEWWWHYDSSTGKVIGEYPVYSVHQDSLVPFTFKFLKLATNRNFDNYTNKGLIWLTNKNKLNANIIDENNLIINRAITIPKINRYMKTVGAILKLDASQNGNNLDLLEETRTFHYGWILFAHSDLSELNTEEEKKSVKKSSISSKLKIYNI